MEDLANTIRSLQSLSMHCRSCPIHTPGSPMPSQPFRFLDLPPEIRNQIATLVLTSDEPIRIRQPKFNRHPSPSPEPMFLSHPRLDFPLPRTPPPTPPGEDEETVKQCLTSREKDGHTRLALLMTCRQAYSDHWATYYSSNTFSFTPSTWPAFSSAIPLRCLAQIRHIRARMPYHCRHIQTWRAMGELEHLETVDVVLAPPGNATRLERVNCVQGVRFCSNLRRIGIEREGIGEGIGPLADDRERKEVMEDKKVEKSVNRDLAARWRRKMKNGESEQNRLGRRERKATSRSGSEAREGKRARRHDAIPDEAAVDAYFSMVQSDDESGTEET